MCRDMHICPQQAQLFLLASKQQLEVIFSDSIPVADGQVYQPDAAAVSTAPAPQLMLAAAAGSHLEPREAAPLSIQPHQLSRSEQVWSPLPDTGQQNCKRPPKSGLLDILKLPYVIS